METELNFTTAGGFWSQTGAEVAMESLDNTNGNKFIVDNNTFVIVQNTDAGSQSIQFTSQPDAETGRTGNINQLLAAGEIRVFRFTRRGWADSTSYVLMPSGQSVNIKAGVIRLV